MSARGQDDDIIPEEWMAGAEGWVGGTKIRHPNFFL